MPDEVEENTMSDDHNAPAGPDLTQGVALTDLKDGKLAGHVGDSEVLLVKVEDDIFAVDAHCTHYHGPLAEGLVVGKTIRCPWHHACFDLRSGEATCAPAFAPLDVWQVERNGDRVVVRDKRAMPRPAPSAQPAHPRAIVVVGAGAAGFAAAEMLRRRGYGGRLTMIGHETSLPVDRPNLSKDYLAGSAPEDWLPLRPEDFYRDAEIDLRLGLQVSALDTNAHAVVLTDGERIAFDKLLLATGAEPIRLPIPGGGDTKIFTLRSQADCRAIIDAAAAARRVLVVGASFIGLEVAASLRTRGLEVHVVAPEARPMERVLGAAMGDFVRALHEKHGVVFHLGDTVAGYDGQRATLKSGATIDADMIVEGVGVKPRLDLAERAGLAIDRGVVVDAFLQTSAPDIYAAGDIARWPDPHSAARIRVEHWVVAERQGQTAALNMLGENTRFDAVPFFWSQHYDVPINYVGHAEQWDEIVVEGSITDKDCLLRYRKDGRQLAVASIFRDLASLMEEAGLERGSA
jgi:NADPH-dependent 2,4-dienoyl-CoA reductase/sulfur reductase-like enzyme/nitrite reductase/ring-hydroxylating ferredoxin subunit